MFSAMGITPKSGPAIQDPGMCGSCHTIILPVYDKSGNQVMENGQPKTFVEQATFPEWLNSKFSNVPCQTCHMPTEFHGDPLDPNAVLAYKIANIEDNTFPAVPFREPDLEITMNIEQPFSRHLLLGINTFALEMFKQFRKPLGLYAQDPYLPGKFAPVISGQDTAIAESVDEASTQTATVQILSATISACFYKFSAARQRRQGALGLGRHVARGRNPRSESQAAGDGVLQFRATDLPDPLLERKSHHESERSPDLRGTGHRSPRAADDQLFEPRQQSERQPLAAAGMVNLRTIRRRDWSNG
jgi:hypothetical protein